MPQHALPIRQPPADPVPTLLRLVASIHGDAELDVTLHRLCDAVAELLGLTRVSARVLDETRTRLLVAARSGMARELQPSTEFVVGEGLVGWVVAQGETIRLTQAETDPRFLTMPHQPAVAGSFLGVPLLDDEGCIGVLSMLTAAQPAFTAQDEQRVLLAVRMLERSLQLGRLRRLATLDPLTAAYNRRALEQFVPSQDDGQRLSAAMLDLDHFKGINDRHGHAVGDEVLRRLVETLHGMLRHEDRVLRMGGEEFLILLPGAPLAAAAKVTERARQRIGALVFGADVRVTVSAGLAERGPGESREAFVARADLACYRAKASGRDALVVDPG